MRSRGYSDLSSLHVLLVEDEADQRKRIVAQLEEVGCRVDVAMDGGSAVRRSAALRPNVVLMGLGLPGMDGWEAMRTIREGPKAHQPYIVAMSGLQDGRSRQLAFEMGCNEYVIKPLDVRGALRAFVARRPHHFQRRAGEPWEDTEVVLWQPGDEKR